MRLGPVLITSLLALAGNVALAAAPSCARETSEVSLLQVDRRAEVVVAADATWTLLAEAPSRKPHEVEHVALLNNNRFWLLMGAIVVSMSILVLRLEVNGSGTGTGNLEAARPHASQTPSDTEEESPWLRLLFCFGMLQVVMLLWGVAQEFVMTKTYTNAHGHQQKMVASFPILWNRLFSIFLFGTILACRREMSIFRGFWMSGAPALTNAAASWCQYESLRFITFALQTAGKSTKLLPVVMINSFRGKPQTLLDYAEAITLASAMFVFGIETQGSAGVTLEASIIGVVLLLGGILLDSATPHLQDMVFDMNPSLTSVQVMFSTSCIAASVLFIVQTINTELFAAVTLLMHNPQAVLHLTVLAVSSAMVQYFILYTIKNFGPVVLTFIVTVRQMLSVFVSSLLFKHYISSLAMIAMIMAFFVVIVRALRKPLTFARKPASESQPQTVETSSRGEDQEPSPFDDDGWAANNWIVRKLLGDKGDFGPLVKCTLAIHVFYCVYAVAQEYLATHTFQGNVFNYPLFLVAVNHTCAAFFALGTLYIQGVPRYVPEMKYTLLPAIANLVGTVMQHWSLYDLLFPTHTLMKCLKIVPVMLIGSLLRNRTYTKLDYVEGILITGLVAYFVANFQFEATGYSVLRVTSGLFMMIAYIFADSFTSPAQDYVYQLYKLDPGQMLLGMETISCVIAWFGLMASGQLISAMQFLVSQPGALLEVGLLALASAAGAFTSTLTVRLYGPAVFVLLMTSRQSFSLVISVFAFQHKFNWRSCLCLVVVCLVVLVSSIRRVASQLRASKAPSKDQAWSPQLEGDTGTKESRAHQKEGSPASVPSGIN